MSELKGSLSAVGLPAIVHLIGELHQSGYLQLRKQQTTAQLIFDDGRLIAAQCGEAHGVDAVALCASQLSDGEFTFVEGSPVVDHAMDLSSADLNRVLGGTPNGRHSPAINRAEHTTVLSPALACPLLGFADNRSRHYGRPTALHRCFAAGAPDLVTVNEQRELCLSGDFATCPRYRTADLARLASETDAMEVQPPPTAAQVPPPLMAANQLEIDRNPTTYEPPSQPADLTGAPPAARARPIKSAAAGRASQGRTRPGLLLTTAAAVVGLCLLAALALFALPASGRLGLRPVANPLEVEPASTATSLPAPLAVATPVSVPTLAPPAVAAPTLAQPVVAPTVAPAAAAPTLAAPAAALTLAPPAVAAPTLVTAATVLPSVPTPATSPAPANGQLMDERFATRPAANWVDNAPYAGWSDGAYRLDAHDATRFVAVGVPLNQDLTDVVVSATLRKTGGPPGGGYGLIVRAQGDQSLDGVNQELSGYVLETGDRGEYGIWRRDGDHWVDLVPWTQSSTVRSGGSPNDLSVTAVGSQLTFTVNGSVLATVNDDTFASGRVGLFVGGDDNQVAVDRFSVELP